MGVVIILIKWRSGRPTCFLNIHSICLCFYFREVVYNNVTVSGSVDSAHNGTSVKLTESQVRERRSCSITL